MGIMNCPQCGKLFVESPAGLCPECYAEQQQDEVKVADYLREVGKSSVPEIHRATGVKEKVIIRMIKQGRILTDFNVSYPCEVCGKMIDEGRLCLECSQHIVKQIKPKDWEKEEHPTRTGERMYTRDSLLRDK